MTTHEQKLKECAEEIQIANDVEVRHGRPMLSDAAVVALLARHFHDPADVQSPPMKCPHCHSGLLWSEDRGPHCDGCDDFNPETDTPAPADANQERCGCGEHFYTPAAQECQKSKDGYVCCLNVGHDGEHIACDCTNVIRRWAATAPATMEAAMCEQCSGQGWFMGGPTDHPEQRQCAACYGAGRIEKASMEAELAEALRELGTVAWRGGDTSSKAADIEFMDVAERAEALLARYDAAHGGPTP